MPASSRACVETWTDVGHDSFAGPLVAPRSQGAVAVDTPLGGPGWIFSGLNGLLEKTDAAYHTLAVGTLPADTVEPSIDQNGNHVSATHIGDIDAYDGKLYASVEDGNESEGPVSVNDPEYQHPYVAVYDAQTLVHLHTYALPLDHQVAGVPWVAVNGPAGEAYTGEWQMPHDRINVYNLSDFSLKRTIPLVYPASLGAGFRLSRIQGAKLLDGALYATRDDDAKTLFKIDLASGEVSKILSLDPPAGVPAELEGLAVTQTPSGATLHLMLILHNHFDASFDFRNIVTEFHHLARSCA
jgi:hypothetical protein